MILPTDVRHLRELPRLSAQVVQVHHLPLPRGAHGQPRLTAPPFCKFLQRDDFCVHQRWTQAPYWRKSASTRQVVHGAPPDGRANFSGVRTARDLPSGPGAVTVDGLPLRPWRSCLPWATWSFSALAENWCLRLLADCPPVGPPRQRSGRARSCLTADVDGRRFCTKVQTCGP